MAYEASEYQCGAADAPCAYVFHTVTGGVGIYKPLIHALSAEWSVFGFSAPGSKIGQSTPTSIVLLAELYAAEVHRTARGPIVLIGFCAGGLIAFEVARLLGTRHALEPDVVLIDTNLLKHKVPQRIPLLRRMYWDTWLAMIGQSEALSNSPEFWQLNKRNKLEETLSRMGATNSLERTSAQKAHAVFHGLWNAVQAYRFLPLSVETCLFLPEQTEFPEAVRNWGDATQDRLTVLRVPGAHFDAMRSPIVEEIAASICRRSWKFSPR